MAIYSLLLMLVLVVGAPYGLVRMMTSGRYRAGLWGRLGRVPAGVKGAGDSADKAGRALVWVHAVSVGEVLAASAMVRELQGVGLAVAVSTTTMAGQELAKKRFPECSVFYMPLDFGVVVRRYLKALRPKLVVTMESELWPNVIRECRRAGVPLAVVNARVSDRSFPRYMQLRAVWGPRLREVTLFLAQSEETAERLRRMGVAGERVRVTGNLKFDVKAPQRSGMVERILRLAGGRPILVAGSTVARLKDDALSEEEIVIQAWEGELRRMGVMLVLAPRHTDRFGEVESVIHEFRYRKASELTLEDGGGVEEGNPPLRQAQGRLFAKSAKDGPPGFVDGPPDSVVVRPTHDDDAVMYGAPGFVDESPGFVESVEIVLLDTIGDLASVYSVAAVAFVGGSLVAKGGHNPLEPAQFGVPVVMGPSYENFKEIVGAVREADAIRIVERGELTAALVELMTDRALAEAIGARGRAVFEAQSGATERTVSALTELLGVRGG
jgi:3-deoxy-D-manno-octulosonic-acid transferase